MNMSIRYATPVLNTPVPAMSEMDLAEKVQDHTTDVTTSSAQVVPPNKLRTVLWLINDSDTSIYLGFGRSAVANVGVRLNANGGALEINLTNLYRGAVTAIHADSGNKALLIVEIESNYAY